MISGGIQHRAGQTCPTCGQLFLWSPGLGLCPYCDLSQKARSAPYGKGEPCPADCCAASLKPAREAPAPQRSLAGAQTARPAGTNLTAATGRASAS